LEEVIVDLLEENRSELKQFVSSGNIERRLSTVHKQLPLYLLACRDLYDEPIHRAGYAYVGQLGPNTAQRSFTDSELDAVKQEIEGLLSEISGLSYEKFVADAHCQWCTHSELPCAPDALQD